MCMVTAIAPKYHNNNRGLEVHLVSGPSRINLLFFFWGRVIPSRLAHQCQLTSGLQLQGFIPTLVPNLYWFLNIYISTVVIIMNWNLSRSL